MHISGKVHKIEQKTDTDTDINENDSYQKRYGQILCKFQLIIFVCSDLINNGYGLFGLSNFISLLKVRKLEKT